MNELNTVRNESDDRFELSQTKTKSTSVYREQCNNSRLEKCAVCAKTLLRKNLARHMDTCKGSVMLIDSLP